MHAFATSHSIDFSPDQSRGCDAEVWTINFVLLSHRLCKPSTWHHVLSILFTPFGIHTFDINYTIMYGRDRVMETIIIAKMGNCTPVICIMYDSTYYFTHLSSDKSFIGAGKSTLSLKFSESHAPICMQTKFDCNMIIEMNRLQLNSEHWTL